MNPELRKKNIIELLKEKESISIPDVAIKCKMSEITVRRDLAELEAKGFLVRTHGGAVLSKTIPDMFAFEAKANANKQKKEAICKAASELIEDNDVIFIDCGTTLFRLSNYISQKQNIVVITNSLPVASALMNFPNIRLNIIGGEIDFERKAIYGPVSEKNVASYHANKAFIGSDGVSIANGLSSYNERESAVTKKMAECADEVILLADSSKVEKDAFVNFAEFKTIHCLVTDNKLDKSIKNEYTSLGVKVITD